MGSHFDVKTLDSMRCIDQEKGGFVERVADGN